MKLGADIPYCIQKERHFPRESAKYCRLFPAAPSCHVLIAKPAFHGDALAKKIFDYTGKMLGRSFADFVAFSSPEAIVLFGGLARAKEFFYEPMLESMNENLMPQWKGKVKIVFSQLKESDAAILGASALAWEL